MSTQGSPDRPHQTMAAAGHAAYAANSAQPVHGAAGSAAFSPTPMASAWLWRNAQLSDLQFKLVLVDMAATQPGGCLCQSWSAAALNGLSIASATGAADSISI